MLPSIDDLRVPLGDGRSVSARRYRVGGGREALATFLFAHGAGAGHRHPFMVACAEGLAARGVETVTFNFPYMEAGRRLPDTAHVLEQAYLAAIGAVRRLEGVEGRPFFIGGKSMGGRMASHVAARHTPAAGSLSGLVFLGYPLHPPGRPDRRRDAHLPDIAAPALFVQGERDAFGTPDELRPVLARLGAPAHLIVVDGGDHSFAVPRATGRSPAAVRDQVLDGIVAWMRAAA